MYPCEMATASRLSVRSKHVRWKWYAIHGTRSSGACHTWPRHRPKPVVRARSSCPRSPRSRSFVSAAPGAAERHLPGPSRSASRRPPHRTSRQGSEPPAPAAGARHRPARHEQPSSGSALTPPETRRASRRGRAGSAEPCTCRETRRCRASHKIAHASSTPAPPRAAARRHRVQAGGGGNTLTPSATRAHGLDDYQVEDVEVLEADEVAGAAPTSAPSASRRSAAGEGGRPVRPADACGEILGEWHERPAAEALPVLKVAPAVLMRRRSACCAVTRAEPRHHVVVGIAAVAAPRLRVAVERAAADEERGGVDGHGCASQGSSGRRRRGQRPRQPDCCAVLTDSSHRPHASRLHLVDCEYAGRCVERSLA